MGLEATITKILSLDGGGTWALIEAAALIEIFGPTTTGHHVLANFDLVAATSGGSIVLGGLIEDLTLAEIRDRFLAPATAAAIFSPTSRLDDQMLRDLSGIGPKYATAAKLPALRSLMPTTGNLPLRDALAGIPGPSGAPVHALILSFDYDANRAAFLRSGPAGAAAYGNGDTTGLTVAGCIHASTNAPVDYFDSPAIAPPCPNRFWDGGLTGQNNPVLAACIEALVLGFPVASLRVLSLGTGTVRLPPAAANDTASPYLAPRQTPSVTSDLRKLATAILDDPPDFATYAAHVLTSAPNIAAGGANDTTASGASDNPPSRITRLNPLIRPVLANGAWTTPPGLTPAQFTHLCGLGMDALAPADLACIDALAAAWIAGTVPNQPIRMAADFTTELGADSFPQAVATWKRQAG